MASATIWAKIGRRTSRWVVGGKDETLMHQLQRDLVMHVASGDPVDVANYCMFLWNMQAPTMEQ